MNQDCGSTRQWVAASSERESSVPRQLEPSPTPVVLTADDVAALLRIARSTVYKLKDCDGLPFHKFGGSVRFYLDEITQWMADQPSTRTKESFR